MKNIYIWDVLENIPVSQQDRGLVKWLILILFIINVKIIYMAHKLIFNQWKVWTVASKGPNQENFQEGYTV